MPRKPEQQLMAEAIMRQHDGQAYFNFGEASKIIGCGRHTLACALNEAGILVRNIGPSKRISALDIATLMTWDRDVPYGK